MTDLLEIFSTLIEFFSFVLLATVLVCVPVVILLWSSEFADRFRATKRRRDRRTVLPLTKIA